MSGFNIYAPRDGVNRGTQMCCLSFHAPGFAIWWEPNGSGKLYCQGHYNQRLMMELAKAGRPKEAEKT